MNPRARLAGLALTLTPVLAGFCAAALAGGVNTATTPVERDGAHDFDFNLGTWHTHIRRLTHPLSGSSEWVGQIEEIEADGASGHFEGLTVFLYNPQSHQWNQTFANSSDGTLGSAEVGEFRDGRGELLQQETYHGRVILVRAVWSDISPDAHHFEQSFSADGGRTWEPNFVGILTRQK
jgi:hypothetical protein